MPQIFRGRFYELHTAEERKVRRSVTRLAGARPIVIPMTYQLALL